LRLSNSLENDSNINDLNQIYFKFKNAVMNTMQNRESYNFESTWEIDFLELRNKEVCKINDSIYTECKSILDNGTFKLNLNTLEESRTQKVIAIINSKCINSEEFGINKKYPLTLNYRNRDPVKDEIVILKYKINCNNILNQNATKVSEIGIHSQARYDEEIEVSDSSYILLLFSSQFAKNQNNIINLKIQNYNSQLKKGIDQRKSAISRLLATEEEKKNHETESDNLHLIIYLSTLLPSGLLLIIIITTYIIMKRRKKLKEEND